jgi:hypothetical protein
MIGIAGNNLQTGKEEELEKHVKYNLNPQQMQCFLLTLGEDWLIFVNLNCEEVLSFQVISRTIDPGGL